MIVIAVKEPALVTAVKGNVGRVQIDDDPARRAVVSLEEQVDQQRIGLGPVEVDLVLFHAVPLGPMLQSVQGALARQGLTVAATRGQLADQHREDWILAQLDVVNEVVVAERQTEDPLAQQRFPAMFDKARITPVGEARRQPPNQAEALVDLSQQQRPGVRRDGAAVEPRHHCLAFHRFKREQLRVTVRRHPGDSQNPVTLSGD